MGPFDCAAVTLPACRAVLQRLTEDDLARPTPCAEYTVSDVGQHLVRSMVLLASVAGEPLDGPAAGTLDTQVADTAEAALAAWRRRGLDGSVAVGRSVLPASLAMEIIPLELLVHGWDIAQATGPASMSRPRSRATCLTAPGSSSPRTSGGVASPPRCPPARTPRSCAC